MSEPAGTAPVEVKAASESTGALADLDGVLKEADPARAEVIVVFLVRRLRGPGLTSVAVDWSLGGYRISMLWKARR